MSTTHFLTDPSKRYVVVDSPQSIPGHCAFSRVSTDEWYIDTRMNEQGLPGHRGAVYVGKTTFDEWARLVKYLSPEDHEKLSAYAQEAEERLHVLETQVTKWKQVFDELDRIGLLSDGMRSRITELTGNRVESLPTEQLATPKSDESSESGENETVSAAFVPDQPSSKSGANDTGSSQPAKRTAPRRTGKGAGSAF